MREPVRFRGSVKTVVVTVGAGRWYVSFGLAFERCRGAAAPGTSAGVDAGVKTLAMVASSDSEVVETLSASVTRFVSMIFVIP